MYILTKSLNTQKGEHFPIILKYDIFNNYVDLNTLNLLYKSFIFSFTFTTEKYYFLQDWETANEIFSDWELYNQSMLYFYDEFGEQSYDYDWDNLNDTYNDWENTNDTFNDWEFLIDYSTGSSCGQDKNWFIINDTFQNWFNINNTFQNWFLSTTDEDFINWFSINNDYENWLNINDIFRNWQFKKGCFKYTNLLNWYLFVKVFEKIFSKINVAFNGIDDWVEANYVYENWTNYGDRYYYEYLPYSLFETMLDNYLTAYGWFVFIYLDKFDCKVIKDVLNTIPIEILLSKNIDVFINLFNKYLSDKYGKIVIDEENITIKRKKFIKFVFNLIVKSFTNTQFIDTAYSLFNYDSTRDCIESMGVGFTLDEEFKYNAFIKEW